MTNEPQVRFSTEGGGTTIRAYAEYLRMVHTISFTMVISACFDALLT